MPKAEGLRPTPAKVRQALFNILGSVESMKMLDLFAGSGVMALEALSRGAAQAISIEQQRPLTQQMLALRDQWQLEARWEVHAATVERALSRFADQNFDLVFADPPYLKGFAEKIPAWLEQSGVRCGQLVIEESKRARVCWPDGWCCESSRDYGSSVLHFLRRA